MNLAQALRLLPTHGPLPSPALNSSNLGQGWEGAAFVGAGGKTTALFQLAGELAPPVVVTTTTHLGAWQISPATEHTIIENPEDIKGFTPRGVSLVTGKTEGDRVKGLDFKAISWLHEVCKNSSLPLLVEADGARQKPLKAPDVHEPVIPDFVQVVVQVAGLTGLHKPLGGEYVHRFEIFARLSGLQVGESITPSALGRVLTHLQGGLKNIPAGVRRVVLLNQADTPELQAQAKSITKDLLATYHAAIIASLQAGQVHAVHEPIAGIVLAAGESVRFGQPKQLLDWRGEPFVRTVTRTALEAGLSPVVVVTGAYADRVETAVRDLPVQLAHNPEWQSGQSSSIRAGLSILPYPPLNSKGWGEGDPQGRAGVGGGIFLLADQPQVTPPILQALMEEHASTLAPIVTPLVNEQRANPVLFDRATFPDLSKLEGDIGGRGIFSKHRITYLPWHDEALLLDVDTPEQYQRLKELLA